MSNQTPATQESMASVIGNQVMSTVQAAAPAIIGTALVAGAIANPQATAAAAGALTALPYAMNLINSAFALSQIGGMPEAQVLQLLHQTSDNLRAHQAALDALDPAYAATVPMTTPVVPSTTPSTTTIAATTPTAPAAAA